MFYRLLYFPKPVDVYEPSGANKHPEQVFNTPFCGSRFVLDYRLYEQVYSDLKKGDSLLPFGEGDDSLGISAEKIRKGLKPGNADVRAAVVREMIARVKSIVTTANAILAKPGNELWKGGISNIQFSIRQLIVSGGTFGDGFVGSGIPCLYANLHRRDTRQQPRTRVEC